MIKNNFYARLELPAEKFENDTAKLKVILEKTRKKWRQSSSLKIQA